MKINNFIENYPKKWPHKKVVLTSFTQNKKTRLHRKILTLLRVGAVTEAYFKEATISGFKRIVEENRTLCERFMWMVIMFIASCASIWMSVNMLMDYSKVPFVTSQVPKGSSVNSVPFPAVSICSTNRISKIKLEELAVKMIKQNKTDGQSFEQTMSQLRYLSIFYDIYNEELKYEVDQLHVMLGYYDVRELLKQLTPPCEDFLVRCLWNGLIRNCSNLFELRLTKEGYCCTFNYLRSTDDFVELEQTMDADSIPLGNLTSNGITSGLSLVLNMSEDDHFYSSFLSGGAQIMLFHNRQFPDPHTGGVKIQYIFPETKVQLTVLITEMETSEELSSVSIEKRGCVFAIYDMKNPLYKYADCLAMCRVFYIQRECGCTPFNLPKNPNSRTCNLLDFMCAQKAMAKSISYRPYEKDSATKYPELMEGLDCHICLPECSTIDYKIGHEIWPLVVHGEDTLADDYEDILIRGLNMTANSILHIRHESDTTTGYKRTLIYKWFDLISTFGSICGMVTGFSFISLIEIFYFYGTRRSQSKKKKTKQVTKKPAAFQHGNIQSIYWMELVPK